ncbi:hypothetical protein LG951_05335 [Bacillus pumilus]|uniref:hypothetical protein n=1 Tax=Bacillus pumilus TaxID=1408 RepID=UPI001D008DB8|nr:hypothetical protein [Bacillus pumilus]UDF17614.1 hypothetical protein LG951_05335 [Bacillus pumilus]
MAFTKEIPQWENAGQKPPQSKISEGFKPMDHPPADWFNWYMNGTYEALNELQSEAATTTEVTAGLKVLSNDIAAHSNAKNNPHAVTKSQVGLGDVDNIKQAAKSDFDNHVEDKLLHTSEVEKSKWNNGQLYKMTQDSGTRKLIPDGADLLTLPPGLYYGINNRLLNNPDPTDTGWFNYDISDSNSGRKMIIAVASFKNTMWFGTVHTNGDFKGWRRIITDVDAKLNWKFPTIENGWKTYKSEVNNDYRVRVAKDVMGIVHVTGAIAGGTLGDVHAFMLPAGCEPPFPLYNVGIASSTGGFKGPQVSRQYIATDGRFCIQDTSSNTEFIVVNCMFKAKE